VTIMKCDKDEVSHDTQEANRLPVRIGKTDP
jgi:hypothetical protein